MSGELNQQPPDPVRSASRAASNIVEQAASVASNVVSTAAGVAADAAKANTPGPFGGFAPIANLSAAALIGVMLWFSQRDSAAVARDDRAQHAVDLKTVVDMVREHQVANREDNIRNTDQLGKAIESQAKIMTNSMDKLSDRIERGRQLNEKLFEKSTGIKPDGPDDVALPIPQTSKITGPGG